MTDDQLDYVQYRTLSEIRYHIRRFLRFSEEAAQEAGIEPRQYEALLAILGRPPGQPSNIRALAEQLQIRHHSAVELVDRLVHSGLAERTPDPSDHRAVLLEVTPKGHELVQDLVAVHRAEWDTIGPALLRELEALLSEARTSSG